MASVVIGIYWMCVLVAPGLCIYLACLALKNILHGVIIGLLVYALVCQLTLFGVYEGELKYRKREGRWPTRCAGYAYGLFFTTLYTTLSQQNLPRQTISS